MSSYHSAVYFCNVIAKMVLINAHGDFLYGHDPSITCSVVIKDGSKDIKMASCS